jgi:patatin-like phospholipase/acyl hydrolase
MRILSLSGGGIRGIFQAVFLRDLAKALGGPLFEHFDIVAGTSTGAILALGVALDVDLDKAVDLFETEGPDIFPEQIQRRAKNVLCSLGRGPFYDAKVFERALRSMFRAAGREALVSDCKTNILIPTTTLDRYEARIFSNLDRCGTPGGLDGRLFAADIALASAAAPSFFKSHQPSGLDAIGNVYREERSYVDGGLWANNPVLSAVMSAHRHLQIPFENMKVLSIGNGRLPEGEAPTTFDGMRRALMLRSVLNAVFATQAELAEQTVGTLLNDETFSGSSILRVNVDLPHKIDLDDVDDAVRILKPRAESALKENLVSIKVLLNIP